MAFYDQAFQEITNYARYNEQKQAQQRAAQVAQEKEENERAEWTIGKWIDGYHKATSPAMKNQIRSTMSSYYGALSPGQRAAVEPYIQHSPISKEEEDLRRFLTTNPEPPRPSRFESKISEGASVDGARSFSSSQTPTDPIKYGEDYFRYSDWVKKRDNVVTGRDITEREKFINLGDGNAIIRENDGRVRLVTGYEQSVKDQGLDLGKVNADNGYNFTGTPVVEIQGGIKRTIIRGPSVANPNSPWGMKVTAQEDAPSGIQMVKIPAAASKTAKDWIAGVDNDFNKKMTREIEDAPVDTNGKKDFRTARELLNIAHPNLNWSIVKVRDIPPELWGFIPLPSIFKGEDEYAFIPLPKQTQQFTDSENRPKTFYIGDEGAVVNSWGQIISPSADAFAQQYTQYKSQKTEDKLSTRPAPAAMKVPKKGIEAVLETNLLTPEQKAMKTQVEQAAKALGLDIYRDIPGYILYEWLGKPLEEVMKALIKVYEQQIKPDPTKSRIPKKQ